MTTTTHVIGSGSHNSKSSCNRGTNFAATFHSLKTLAKLSGEKWVHPANFAGCGVNDDGTPLSANIRLNTEFTRRTGVRDCVFYSIEKTYRGNPRSLGWKT